MTAKKLPNEQAAAVQHPDYIDEILGIVRGRLSPKLIREQLADYHENDIAAALELLKKDERQRLFTILDTETLSNVIEYAEHPDEYIGEMSVRKRVDVLSAIEPADAAEYLASLDKTERKLIIDLMGDEAKSEIALISSFDKDEIGSRMTTNYISVRSGITVGEAMRELVEQAAENDNVTTIYVVDEDGTFYGAVDLRDIIIARKNEPLEEIIMTSYPYVYSDELIDDCIERIKDYSEDSIPVLDEYNVLRGVLTAQDMTELVDDVLGEDYARLAGLSAEEDIEEPVVKSVKKRFPWLAVLLGLALVVSSVVGLFEEVVAHLALVVFFQSLVLDMAGNVGTQSLAVTIRVLSDERVSGKQKARLVFKEARTGLLNGLLFGIASFAVIGAYLMFIKGEPAIMAFSVSMCTGLALVVSMLLSSVAGTTIPMLFKKLKIDPAVASGPLITTLNDLVAVVTYYGLVWILLINVLGL